MSSSLPGGFVITDQISHSKEYDLFEGEGPGGAKVCIKAIPLNYRQLKNGFTQESYNLEKLTSISMDRDSHIITLLDCFKDGSHGVVIMEPFDTTLEVALKENVLNEKEKVRIFYEVCLAVNECSEGCVAHMDISPQNIYLINGVVKLANFSSSIRWTTVRSTSMKVIGTPEFRAPEVNDPCGYTPYLTDLWSLGVLLHYLITNKFPDVDLTAGEDGLVTIDSSLPAPIADLISSLLEIKPFMRLPLDALLEHPAFLYYGMVLDPVILKYNGSGKLSSKKKKNMSRIHSSKVKGARASAMISGSGDELC